jgi:preprotein translocase subunit SecY
LIQAFANIFKIPDLRAKVLFTLGIFAIYRIGAYIPTPGINPVALAQIIESASQAQGNTLFGIMNLFSGGAMERLTIFALGIMPYISASIILQLLTVVIPALEKLSKEGEEGRKKIIQYTRYGTVVLSVIQSLFIAMWLENPGNFDGVQLVDFPGWGFRALTVITLTTGTAFIMWLGEQIDAKGIGNGISLIITIGIISAIPTAASLTWQLLSPFDPARQQLQWPTFILLVAMGIGVVVGVILITQGQRRIPVQYGKRVVGRKVYGGQSTYIPLRVNLAGVIPIIFAQSIILFPATIGSLFPNSFIQSAANALQDGQWLHTILYSTMIIFFCYFYTAIIFNPVEVADNMKKYGGFIPGIRPGKPTAAYFDYVMTRITLAGAIFLAFIAILPTYVSRGFNIHFLIASFFGGTGLLIIVGVMLDSMKQVESNLLMRHYDGFMKKGKLRGRK